MIGTNRYMVPWSKSNRGYHFKYRHKTKTALNKIEKKNDHSKLYYNCIFLDSCDFISADLTVKLHMHSVVVCFDMKTSAEKQRT